MQTSSYEVSSYKRGKAEQWIKEGKYALNWMWLSSHRFAANQVRLALFVLAYNLGNFLRRLALSASIQHWSLHSIQTKLIKIGARVVFHTRRIIFKLAEVAVPKQLFSRILDRIWALAPGEGCRRDLVRAKLSHLQAHCVPLRLECGK